MLIYRQIRLEKNIIALTDERIELAAQLDKRTLTHEENLTIHDFAERVATGIKMIEYQDDYHSRKCIIDALDVTASVVVEGEERIAYLKCLIVETILPITDNPIPEIVLFVALQTRSV